MQPISSKAILSAVGELLAEERAARLALAARIDEYGNLVRTPGPQGERGLPGERGEGGRDGRDGRPGEQGLDGPAGPVGERGEPGPVGEPAYPGRACGLWNGTEAYRAMDVVAFNGSEWRATKDDPGPLPGDGWKQGAKGIKGEKGARGDRGEPGARGLAGPQGPQGVGIDDIILENGVLVFVLTDGRQKEFMLEGVA
jgi:hypothetical protein